MSQRFELRVLIDADHAGMVEFSKSLSVMLPMFAGNVKIVNAVIAEPVKSAHSQPTEQKAP